MKRAFMAIVALQMAWLLGQTALYQGRISGGETVYLRVVPSDPRSLFMGNYATLRFDISTIDGTSLGADAAVAERGADRIYVAVSRERPGRLVRAALSIPGDRQGLVWLRGACEGRTWGAVTMLPDGSRRPYREKTEYLVEYGLERYYVSPERGREMDELTRRMGSLRKRRPEVLAEVSVGPDGGAMLRRILVDGKPL